MHEQSLRVRNLDLTHSTLFSSDPDLVAALALLSILQGLLLIGDLQYKVEPAENRKSSVHHTACILAYISSMFKPFLLKYHIRARMTKRLA